jgi:hypothetical protein
LSSDEVLEYFVQRVEETGVGISIQLCVKGLIIVGSLTSSKQYYDRMSTIFNSNMQIETNDQTEIKLGYDYFEHYKQFMLEKRKHSEEQGGSKYIHLHNVVIYPTDPSKPITADYWRGKLSSVDGFSLGEGPFRVKYST